MKIMYRLLELEECNRIKEIDASQYIGRAWRGGSDSRQLVEINYQELDTRDVQLEYDYTKTGSISE